MNIEISQGAHLLQKRDTSVVAAEVLDSRGRLAPVPSSVYEKYEQETISQFCVERALYFLPTKEVVEFINDLVGGRDAIEIGAGCGVLGRALGLRMTDSFQQEDPLYKMQYALMRQPTIKYGDDVIKADALTAVKRFKPDTVIAAWVTHKFNPKQPERMGNEVGVDMLKLLKRVRRFILIGNDSVHGLSPLMDLSHEVIEHPALYSRSLKRDKNRIYVWER